MAWCDPCDRYFVSECALEQHINNSSAHDNESSEEESVEYECETCNRCFSTERAADQHMEALGHRAPRYECDTCTKEFLSCSAAENHMNAVGHWEHYCDECRRKFDNSNDLHMHRNSRIHRGSTVLCQFCSRAFVSASGMSHHLESGSCPKASNLNRESIRNVIRICDPNGLITKNQLEWHCEFEVTDNCWNGHGYECYLCHEMYNSLTKLNRHVNSGPHQQKIYHCPNRLCSKEFVSLAGLFNHLESESCGFIRFERVQKNVTHFFDGSRLIGF